MNTEDRLRKLAHLLGGTYEHPGYVRYTEDGVVYNIGFFEGRWVYDMDVDEEEGVFYPGWLTWPVETPVEKIAEYFLL